MFKQIVSVLLGILILCVAVLSVEVQQLSSQHSQLCQAMAANTFDQNELPLYGCPR